MLLALEEFKECLPDFGSRPLEISHGSLLNERIGINGMFECTAIRDLRVCMLEGVGGQREMAAWPSTSGVMTISTLEAPFLSSSAQIMTS